MIYKIHIHTHKYIHTYKQHKNMLIPQKITINSILIVHLSKVDSYIADIKQRYPRFQCTYFTHRENSNLVQLAIKQI